MADVNFTINVPRGQERFRELIVYISQQCAEDPTFGATKLNKVLFYADVIAYERLGQPLTGMRYFRLERGPAPQPIKAVQRALVSEGAIRIDDRIVEGNYTQKRTVALRDPDVDLFTKSELSIVDEVIKSLWAKSAKRVSDESHGIAWRSLRNEEMIPYEVAFLSDEGATNSDVIDARQLNERYGWDLRI